MTRPSEQNLKYSKLKMRVSILWIGVIFCLFLWVIGSSYIWQNFEKTKTTTEETLQNTGQRMAQYTSLSFQQIDLALERASQTFFNQRNDNSLDMEALDHILAPLFSSYEQISHVQIYDEDANIIFAHLSLEEQFIAPLSHDIKSILKSIDKSRTFFAKFQNSPGVIMFKPVMANENDPTFFMSATIRAKYLDNIFNAGLHNENIFFYLSSRERGLHNFPHSLEVPHHTIELTDSIQSTYNKMVDHQRTLIVTTQIPDFDLQITLLKTHDLIFKDWRNEMTAYAIIASIFTTFILYGAASLNKSVRRLHEEIDIRHQTEQDLRVVSQAVEQSPASVIITDKYANITYVNHKFSETSGYTYEEVIGQNPKILSSGKQDRRKYEEMWADVLDGKSWSGEFHNRKKDGSLYWESTMVKAILDEDNQISHFLAVKEDITMTKQSQDQLKMAAAVIETASEAIMVCDRFNRIMMVNSSFTDITGFEYDEAIGQTPALLNSGRHDTEFFAGMFNTLKRDGQWQGEIWNRRKNGEVYPQWLSIKTITNTEGKIDRYISLFTDITKRKQDEERILYQANYDALTGLPNRTLFQDRLERAVIRAERTQKKIALMFLDLDRFKNVNDTLGHAAGDKLLVEAAKRLRSTVRKVDSVARLGGDEFTIILQDLQSEHQTKSLIEKLLKNLSAAYEIGTDTAFVSASIGITIFPDDASNVEELLKNADTAMYRAKESGRNMSQFFTMEMNQSAQKRRALETSLYQALEREEFAIHYQPIVDPETDRVETCEALLRWMHPTHGNVSPATFIPLAEDTGQILPIGRWVINSVFKETKLWEKYSNNPPKVAVNLSSIQFKRANAAELIENALIENNLSPRRVNVEITESLLVEDDEQIMDQLNQIRAMGVGLSIDDFGTGYSSLSYLKKFPITAIKIDRSFIADMYESEDSESIVDAILSMAKSLKLKVVAEGVETNEQRNMLLLKDCPYIQGYYYSPPLPVSAFREMVKTDEPLYADACA